jgi:hypothetical protein
MEREAPGRPAVDSIESRSSVAGPPPPEPGDHGADAEELEDHLREQIASSAPGALRGRGVPGGGQADGGGRRLTREFAREHSERLWKQLVLSGDGAYGGRFAGRLRVAEDVGRPRPGGGGRRGDQDPGALRDRLRRRGPEPLLPAQHQLLHPPVHRRLLRVGPAAPASSRCGLAAAFAPRGDRGERLPVSLRGRAPGRTPTS